MTKWLQFGYTWWGKKWLDALSATDYSNRLPRGARYARNGSVKNIKIEKNKISAKVQGSRPSPYEIEIEIKKFTPNEKAKAVEIIQNNPLILSNLLVRKLPPELWDEFVKNRIQLFPDKWNDLAADCSCPDWADCCKHIAAVIYLIANRIDQNPFLVFEMHNFDLFGELKKRASRKKAIRSSGLKRLPAIFWFRDPSQKNPRSLRLPRRPIPLGLPLIFQ